MFVGVGLGVGRQRVSGGAFVGLLDLYPSASVAYSLRRLSSTYTGNAIRVRRSSDNTEQNIGFDAFGNLDTTALTTFCSGTNGFVTTWYDQSGNSRNATQTTAANQPQIYDSITGYLSNIDFRNIGGVTLVSSFAYNNTIDFTFIQVVQNYGRSIFGTTIAVTDYFNAAGSGDISNSFSNFLTPTIYQNGTIIGNTRNDMFNATTSKSVITTLSKINTNRNLSIGYSFTGLSFNAMKHSELVIYNNQTVNRSQVESNMMTYYGI